MELTYNENFLNTSKRRYSRTLIDVLKELPEISELIENDLDPVAAHELCNFLLSTVEPSDGPKFDPFLEYALLPPESGLYSASNQNAKVFVGKGATINNFRITGTGRCVVFIGENATVTNSHIAANADKNIFILGRSGRAGGFFAHIYGEIGALIMGPGVTSNAGCNFCIEENSYIIMGDDCMLSTNIYIRTSDSHGIYDATSLERLNSASPVVLHRHVWVGRACLLNKGTEVGEGSVLGQGAVTNGVLGPNAVYAGSPAREVRKNIIWDRRKNIK
jgi:acetyltransferase-like isoleucine patch superfamily enzyme